MNLQTMKIACTFRMFTQWEKYRIYGITFSYLAIPYKSKKIKLAYVVKNVRASLEFL